MKIINMKIAALALCGTLAQTSHAVAETSGSQQAISVSRSASRTAKAGPTDWFTGSVQLEMLVSAKPPGRTTVGKVTFQPGARTIWHTHPAGQALIVTDGIGWVQKWGEPRQEMQVGDVVQIPAGVKHWHGATTTSTMTHIAMQEEIEGKNVEWLEPVAQEQYSASSERASAETKEPSAMKQAMGDFAPKIVQLTDDVLFGDVWKRPELAPRDRSLITVAALVAGGNAEQLPFHLNKAKENGLSEDQLVEAMTHLAFYCGWPKALSGINVAKKMFEGAAAASTTPGNH